MHESDRGLLASACEGSGTTDSAGGMRERSRDKGQEPHLQGDPGRGSDEWAVSREDAERGLQVCALVALTQVAPRTSAASGGSEPPPLALPVSAPVVWAVMWTKARGDLPKICAPQDRPATSIQSGQPKPAGALGLRLRTQLAAPHPALAAWPRGSAKSKRPGHRARPPHSAERGKCGEEEAGHRVGGRGDRGGGWNAAPDAGV